MSAVQGAKMIPRTGQIHDEKAALTLDESKIQSRKYANRGPMKAIERARQHMERGFCCQKPRLSTDCRSPVRVEASMPHVTRRTQEPMSTAPRQSGALSRKERFALRRSA